MAHCVYGGIEQVIADDEDESNIRWLPVMAVQPDAMLAKDLCSESGALLLKAGAVLSQSALHKLADAQNMNGFNGNLPIVNEP